MAREKPKSRCLLVACDGFVYSDGPLCLNCAAVFAAKAIERGDLAHELDVMSEEFARAVEPDPRTAKEIGAYEDYLSELAAVRGDARPEVGIEWRDGRAFTVTVLPDAVPPAERSQRTRYRMRDVGKAGDLATPKRRRRRFRRTRRR